MFLHKTNTFFRFLTNDDLARMFQHHTKQGTNTCWSCTYNQNRIFRFDFRNTGSPKPGSQDIANKQSLFICYFIRNTIQPLIGIRYPNIFSLSAINTATQCPTTIRILTVIDITMTTEETIATECLDIHRYTVTRFYRNHIRTDFLHNTYHFMSYCNTRYSPRHTSMFDM